MCEFAGSRKVENFNRSIEIGLSHAIGTDDYVNSLEGNIDMLDRPKSRDAEGLNWHGAKFIRIAMEINVKVY